MLVVTAEYIKQNKSIKLQVKNKMLTEKVLIYL